ncbi:MAG: cytochrome c-type biogenesis protein CcmH [Gammaproteobacteria bacterium]|nr:cytochrome c-type biogenesis protein CcmH [Gammaproteobacteria bacterium]
MRRPINAAFLILLLVISGTSNATLDSFDFSGVVSEQRFRDLIGEVRCLVCQNESLLASRAELAQDLRQEVYDMMAQGKPDDEIISFLVDRYGNFVLYRPPVIPSTFILWFGPFVILLLSAIVLYRIISRRSRALDTQLNEKDRKNVVKLLDD